MDNAWTDDYYKQQVKNEYGLTISNDGKAWTRQNLDLMYTSLGNIDNALNGGLKSMANGWTLQLGEHVPTPLPHGGMTTYDGLTDDVNNTITFNTMGTAAIHQMNIYHEFGHMINDEQNNAYADNISNTAIYMANGYINDNTALKNVNVNDPNYGNRSTQAIQASGPGTQVQFATEPWADAFANYVAGNINLDTNEGIALNNDVTNALFP